MEEGIFATAERVFLVEERSLTMREGPAHATVAPAHAMRSAGARFDGRDAALVIGRATSTGGGSTAGSALH